MKKYLLSFVLGQLFLLVPLVQVVSANCSFSVSGSSSGSCWNASASYSCDGTNGDPSFNCSANYGGCDWGNVSVFYFTGTCV
ncbi:MAG TPA: hypothetical protein PKE69_01885 [Pyrinomonadaceae bacterium]|mgnify:CR=1 FL=1|nr:hypothetical protein [Pyrinomonadaceae bacterium]